MVLLLAGDVRNDRLPPRLTDAERAVTALPGKSVRVLVQPARRIALEVLHRLGQGHGWRKCQQHMKMVSCASNGQQGNVFSASDARQVLPEPLRIGNEVGAIFGAEAVPESVSG